jgi:hypothetical protein
MIIVAISDAKQSKKGKTTVEDPVKMEIDKLRSELTSAELKAAVAQPIKETISAGKGLGQRFGSWLYGHLGS